MEVGKYNKLTINRATSVGFYLRDENGDDVLLPHKYIPEDAEIGMEIEVFIYRDSEDRLIATDLTPALVLNQFAILRVVGVSQHGAFLDWGLEKDLFVPFKEQNQKLKEGDWVPIFLYLDKETDRPVASAKIHQFFENDYGIDLQYGEKVDLLVYEKTDLGYNVIINNLYKGLIYFNEIFQTVAWGDRLKGYIKEVRTDNNIDVSLQPLGFKQTRDLNTSIILEQLEKSGGILHLSDSSDPMDIQEKLGMSKKAFKKAIGGLFKSGEIIIRENSIELFQRKD